MRQVFIDYNDMLQYKIDNNIDTETTTLWLMAPWASEIVGVEGGWRAFESVSDYDTWINQR